MIQFEFNDDGVFVAMSDGAGDLKAKIDYSKLPTLKALPDEERKTLAVVLETVIARLTYELKTQAFNTAIAKLRAIQPLVIAPEEKKLIVPGA